MDDFEQFWDSLIEVTTCDEEIKALESIKDSLESSYEEQFQRREYGATRMVDV